MDNATAGARQLLHQVRTTAKRKRIRPEHVFFGGEDYPSYAENFVRHLRQQKFLVVRVNAWEAKQQRNNFQASSDSLDLLGTARCCLNRRGESLRDLPVAYTNLRIATRDRDQLARNRAAVSNRIHSYVDRLFPGFLNIESSGLCPFCQASLDLMVDRFSPEQFGRRPRQALADRLGRHGVEQPKTVADQLHQLAKGVLKPAPEQTVMLQRSLAQSVDLYRGLEASEGGLLFNTDGSGKRELGGHTASMVMRWGLYELVMSTNATRFAFLGNHYNDGALLQIGTLEINPANLSPAPVLSQTAATPPYLLTNGTPSTFLTTRVSPSTNLFEGNVMADVLLNGMHDASTDDAEPLVDNGSYGDVTAGDGLYSNNSLYAYPWGTNAMVGPRTLRFKAERADSSSMYHATIVELGPFWVLAQAPSGPAPVIGGISPGNVPAGSTVTLTGTGFDPIATNNLVLFGTVPAQIISVNPAGTELVVVVPPGLPSGTVPVTVSSVGQTSGSSTFGGSGTATDWLEVMMQAGVNVHGTLGKTYRIDYLSDLTNTNNWAPLTNLTLPSNPYLWVDVSSTNQPKRFYRSVRVP